MSIVAPKDIQAIFINYCRMTMPRSGGCAATKSRAEYFLPRAVVDTVLIKVVDSVKAIISSENVDRSVMNN